MIEAIMEYSPTLGIRNTCQILGIPRSRLYQARQKETRDTRQRTTSPRALGREEKLMVLAKLNSSEYQDQSPREVYADLLDKGEYLCSVETMYRILAENQEVRERRNLLQHPNYEKPELLATKPNKLWSWDITKMLGPTKWTYYYLYTILDVFSRYVVGWLIAERESASLAEALIAATCVRQGIERGQLTIHADRGSSMTSKPVMLLMADLGVTTSSRCPSGRPIHGHMFQTIIHFPNLNLHLPWRAVPGKR